MPPRIALALLAVAVVCAAVGTALILRGTLLGAPAYGWTAYAPLSRSITSGSARYLPFDTTWLTWAPRVGAALLALGAGTTGALVSAFLLTRRTRTSTGSDATP